MASCNTSFTKVIENDATIDITGKFNMSFTFVDVAVLVDANMCTLL